MTVDPSVIAVQPTTSRTEDLVRWYLQAKREVIEADFAVELEWQESRRLDTVTDIDFFREGAWVVLSSGMNERVVRKIFPKLERRLHGFAPEAVVQDPETRAKAMQVFAHSRKIDAVLTIGAAAEKLGKDGLRHKLHEGPLEFLQTFPYIGPVTSRHFAKNLGASLAKPDRHLVRLTNWTRRTSVQAMCQEISLWLGEPMCVVDSVLWRWATLESASRKQR